MPYHYFGGYLMSNITINCTCPFCRKTHSVEVDYRSYCSWQAGELIQYAMPELTPTEREQLISGICPKCQESIFAPPPEPEDEPLPFEDCTCNCKGCHHYDECFADEEPDDCDYEVGFDPYSGCYTNDC